MRRQPGAPEQAGRDHDGPVVAPRAVIEGDPPPPAQVGLEPLHGGAEPDQRAQPERIRISVEIGGHLAVVREVAIRGGHGEARVLHAQTRGVCSQRCVRPGKPVVVLVAPEPSDLGAPLEALDRNLMLAQRLEHREPGRARPDHGHAHSSCYSFHTRGYGRPYARVWSNGAARADTTEPPVLGSGGARSDRRSRPGRRSGDAAGQTTRRHEGQLLLALRQPGGSRRGRTRRVGAIAHRCRDRGDRGLVGRPAPAASPPLQTCHRTGRTRPDRARAPRDRRSPDRAAGARTRHRPAHRFRRRTLPAARLLTRPGEATGTTRLQRLPRARTTRPRHTATAAANAGSQTRLPERRPRGADLGAERRPAEAKLDRPFDRGQLAVDRIAGVRRALRLDQENVRLFAGTGTMLDAARHDEQVALLQMKGAIAEFDLELALKHEEEVVSLWMAVPDELARYRQLRLHPSRQRRAPRPASTLRAISTAPGSCQPARSSSFFLLDL